VDLYRAGGWWQEEPAWRAAIPQMIRGSLCFLLAREPGGRVVGMGRVISDGASDGYIQDVVVLPESADAASPHDHPTPDRSLAWPRA